MLWHNYNHHGFAKRYAEKCLGCRQRFLICSAKQVCITISHRRLKVASEEDCLLYDACDAKYPTIISVDNLITSLEFDNRSLSFKDIRQSG